MSVPTTEYTPPTEVPDLVAAVKEVAAARRVEHPEYGSCPNCVRAVRLDRMGFLREHKTPELANGNMKVTLQCPGGGRRYAEFGEDGQTWDLREGAWKDLPVELFVMLVAHDQAGDVKLPRWRLAGAAPTELARRAAHQLADGRKWRIDLLFADGQVTGHLIRIDQGDGRLMVWETVSDGVAYNGVMAVMNKLVARMASANSEPVTSR